MRPFFIVLAFLSIALAVSAEVLPFLNCPSICTGAFCQDYFGSPLPRQGETAIKYSWESSVLLTRFGRGVFCGEESISKCIVPNSCLQSGGGGGGGGGGGSPPPVPACSSVALTIPTSIATKTQQGGIFPSPIRSLSFSKVASISLGGGGPAPLPRMTDFWGYNWTEGWLNQCDPQAPPGQRCGMVPSLFVTAECRDYFLRAIACPSDPVWTASVGTLENDPVSNLAVNRIWRSVNYPTPVTITATVNGCTVSSSSASFNLHILDACSLSPSSVALDFGKNETFSGTCYDETKQARPCYYPLMMHPMPSDALGKVTQNTEPTGIPPDNNPIVGISRPPRIWMDSTVNFTAGYIDALGSLSGGGPTFVCHAPITVGNPATACTLTLSSNTVEIGKTIEAVPTCTGPKGPASCPDFDFWAAPAAVVSWQNFSQANVTGLYVGSATVNAHLVPYRQTCAMDQTITFFDLVTPEITTCTYVPHDATASLDLPVDATNIRAYLVGGGTDDGCTKIDVNGQRVFDEGCDAGYRYASCGLHVKAHDLSIPNLVSVPLRAGANTLRGQNVDSYGAFSALRIRIAGSYQARQCLGQPIPTPPITCQAPLTVTSGACTTPPRASSFLPESTRFDLLSPDQLERVPNLVLARPEFRLAYASDVFACAQDFDGGIRSSPGFFALDATRFHSSIYRPQAPVSVMLRNLPYARMPRLRVLDEFVDSPAVVLERGQDCTANGKCTDLNYDSATRTLSFKVNGFSSYASQDSSVTPTPTSTPTATPTVTPTPTATPKATPTPTPSITPTLSVSPNPSGYPTPSASPAVTASPSPSVSPTATLTPNPSQIRFVLDCPLPQMGQNTTRASAFLYENGAPATDSNMRLSYELNQTYAYETYPVKVNPSTGRHDFILDTRYGGTYRLIAASGAWNSNECRLDVFEQESTPIPELSDWAILIVFLAAGFFATARRNKNH